MIESESQATWLESDRFLPKRFVRPALRFSEQEASSGIVLLIAAVVAFVWANLPGALGESYEEFWGTIVEFSIGTFHVEDPLRLVVNEGLMTIFFFVVGLEIKRELVLGELREPKKAALPTVAALGGMIVPAAIYIAFNGVAAPEGSGWGIPMATDIAFSLGVVALLGSRVPSGAKLFLLTLAIVDDIGAILVIAIFYSEDLHLGWLVVAFGFFLLIYLSRRANVRPVGFYWVLGIAAWFAMFESGVEATLAGVALGLMTPARPQYSSEQFDRRARQVLNLYPTDETTVVGREHVDHEALEIATVARESVSPLNRLEEALHPWSSYVVIPLFALANAGVRLVDIDLGEALTSSVTLGVALGLVVGKTVGIAAFTWVALRLNLGTLPRATNFNHVVGLSAVAGIGFTVALFIAALAFTDPLLTDFAKIGIFVGSGVAGLIGYLVLRAQPGTQPPGNP